MSEEKTTTTKGRKKNVVAENESVIVQNDELEIEKAKNAQMADMLKQLQEQMALMQMQLNNQNSGQVVIQQNDNMTRTVKVISCISNRYDLPTQPRGIGGKTYTFYKFGDVQNIRFTDMIEIVSRYTEQFEKGYAILTNKKDYDDLGIGYIWDTVLSLDRLNSIINLETEDAIDTILSMDEDMQDKIAHTIASRISDGYSYDYNMIKELEEEGFNINEIVEMLKAEKE